MNLPTRRTGKVALAIALTGSLLLGTACTTGATGATGAEDEQRLSIVASTAIWGDIAAAAVNEEHVDIHAVVEGNDADPHSFEPSAADMARAAEADLVVAGGGGYDAWLYRNLDETKVIHALPLDAHDHGDHDHGESDHDHGHEHDHEGHDHEHDHGHEGGHHNHGQLVGIEHNEHIWYDTTSLAEVADEIAERVREVNPAAAADTTALHGQLDEIDQRLHDLPGLRVAQSEPIADHIVAHTDFDEVTPAGYRSTTLSHSEPSAADLAAFLQLIDDRELDLLIYNPQTRTDLTERVRAAAEDAGIPVVEIFETPQQGEDFLEFFHDAIHRLESAATTSPDQE